MYCPHCGSPVQQGMMFCPSCGKEIGSILNRPEKNVVVARRAEESAPAAHKQTNTTDSFASSVEDDKRKSKFLACTRAEVISAALAFLSVLLLLFVPIFVNDYKVVVDEETIVKSKKESLFNLCVKCVKLLKGDLESFVFGFGILRLIVAIYAAIIVVFVIKDLCAKISNLVKFDDYYASQMRQSEESERTQELVKQLKRKAWGGTYDYVIAELIIMFLFGGYDGIFWGGVIFVGLVMLSGYVVGKIAKSTEKKLKKQNRDAA